jgi:hypothetical protein
VLSKKEANNNGGGADGANKLTPRSEQEAGRGRNLVKEGDGSSGSTSSLQPRTLANSQTRMIQSFDDLNNLRDDTIVRRPSDGNRLHHSHHPGGGSRDDASLHVDRKKSKKKKKEKTEKERVKTVNNFINKDEEGASGRKMLGASLRKFNFTAAMAAATDQVSGRKSPKSSTTPSASPRSPHSAVLPPQLPQPFAAAQPFYRTAERTVGQHYAECSQSAKNGTVNIFDERYLLLRASALSVEFCHAVAETFTASGTHA